MVRKCVKGSMGTGHLNAPSCFHRYLSASQERKSSQTRWFLWRVRLAHLLVTWSLKLILLFIKVLDDLKALFPFILLQDLFQII